MKKLLMGSVSLLLFSIAIAVFQISCQKEVGAQGGSSTSYILPPATTNSLGGVIVGNGLNVTSNGLLSVNAGIFSSTMTPATSNSLGGIIVGNGLSITSNGVLSVQSGTGASNQSPNVIMFLKQLPSLLVEYWIMNLDGSNLKKIPAPVPSGYSIARAQLSADAKTFVYSVMKSSSSGVGYSQLCSCSLDGSNFKVLIDYSSTVTDVWLEDVK